MAKKAALNKSQAIRDHLQSSPGAMPLEIVAALKKQGITVTAGLAATTKSKLKHDSAKKASPVKKAAMHATPAVSAPSAASAEKPGNGSAITLEQIKTVAHTVHALGGLQRLNELLAVIKETGGLKKFKDLAEAISGTSDAAG